MARVLAVCLLVALALGCSDTAKPCTRPSCQVAPDADPGSAWDVEATFFVNTDQFIEAHLLMSAGDRVTIDLAASPIPAPWNVHSHSGDVEVYHQTGRHDAHQLDFTAPSDDDYFATMLNDRPGEIMVVIRLQLHGGTTFVSWL